LKKSMWGKRAALPSRAERVYGALMTGVCAFCQSVTIDVPDSDPEYMGKNHIRCPKCGWQAQFDTNINRRQK